VASSDAPPPIPQIGLQGEQKQGVSGSPENKKPSVAGLLSSEQSNSPQWWRWTPWLGWGVLTLTFLLLFREILHRFQPRRRQKKQDRKRSVEQVRQLWRTSRLGKSGPQGVLDALHESLSRIYGVAPRSLSRTDLKEAMLTQGASPELWKDLENLLEELEAALYSAHEEKYDNLQRVRKTGEDLVDQMLHQITASPGV